MFSEKELISVPLQSLYWCLHSDWTGCNWMYIASIWFCPPPPPPTPPPPSSNPSSIPTNPTASNHYIALFCSLYCLGAPDIMAGSKSRFGLLMGLTCFSIKKKKKRNKVSTASHHLFLGHSRPHHHQHTHTVWGYSYQTVTDPYPVTQTAPGHWLVGGMV